MKLVLSAGNNSKINEFLQDPTLTVACVMLIVVSLGWIVVTRLIVRNYKRAALRRHRAAAAVVTSERDIWSVPP